jgi:hypothetical protein
MLRAAECEQASASWRAELQLPTLAKLRRATAASLECQWRLRVVLRHSLIKSLAFRLDGG